MRIEISFSQLDPPEGVVARVTQTGDEPMTVPHAFVGWLGLLGVLQLLTDDPVEHPPP